MDAAARMKAGIVEIEGLEIIGDPKASLVAYRSNKPEINIFAVGDQMEAKGWHIDRLQHPDALHAMITAPHDKVIDEYLADLKEAVAVAKAHPELAQTGEAATYGMIAHIPLKGMVRKQVLDMFATSYRLDAQEIDLSDSAAMTPGGESGADASKQSLQQKAINWYVNKKSGK